MRKIMCQKTIVSKEEVLEALWKAWMVYFNAVPEKESIWVLVAQWALETGWGRHMYCFNLGNVKSRPEDGYSFTYFSCNEILPKARAEKYQAEDPSRVKITKYQDDGNAITWFYPEHPISRFRAFDSLQEGVSDYLTLMVQRFSKAWPAVVAGDPIVFSKMLKQQRYYTADEAKYTKSLIGIIRILAQTNFNYSKLEVLTSYEKTKIKEAVAHSLDFLAKKSI